MNESEWFEKAIANRFKLYSFLSVYHPSNRQPGRRPEDFITAPNVENACTQVRKQIRDEFEGDPTELFKVALLKKDLGVCLTLLNQAWFGVPESTTCWQIEGFKEAVDLMEDTPDE